MKICTRCKEEKELIAFSKRAAKKDGHDIVCKSCRALLYKKRYKDNIVRYRIMSIIKNNKKRDRNRLYILEYLSTHHCVDCGESDPIVLEFDHIKGIKVNSIANLGSHGSSISIIQNEIDKCEVRCANCHRRKTATQLNWYNRIESNLIR